jgi:hypothetical protein
MTYINKVATCKHMVIYYTPKYMFMQAILNFLKNIRLKPLNCS